MAKRVTMGQIAQAAHVSRTTVSFVLNNVPGVKISPETRQRILDAAREFNYVPDSAATSLVSGRTGTIALVTRQSTHQLMSDRFLLQVLLGISAAVRAQGFHVLVEPLDPADESASYGNLVRSHRADGLIVSNPCMDDDELRRIYAEGIPVVLIGQLPLSNIPFIDVDNVNAAYVAVDHLIKLGHRRIACIANAPLVYASGLDRLAGYQRALENAGIPYDSILVHHGDNTDESGTQAMSELLALTGRPTAVFVASDVMALGAMAAIRAAGLEVPRDIAVVGCDDIPLAQYISPPLTTIRLPAYGLGWGAADMLLRLILERDTFVNTQVQLDTELVIRESCGAARRVPAG